MEIGHVKGVWESLPPFRTLPALLFGRRRRCQPDALAANVPWLNAGLKSLKIAKVLQGHAVVASLTVPRSPSQVWAAQSSLTELSGLLKPCATLGADELVATACRSVAGDVVVNSQARLDRSRRQRTAARRGQSALR